MCTRFCLCSQVSVSPVLCKFCNQIPLASKVKFPGGSQPLCWTPRLGNLVWVLELWQQCRNFFGTSFSSLWAVCSVALWWGSHAAPLRSAAARSPVRAAGHCWPMPLQETFKHSRHVWLSLLWGPWALVHTRFCLSPPSTSGGDGFDSICDFPPPATLLGLLLGPWMWSIFLRWDPTFSCGWLFSS